jgi:small subunit ribosomal protein S6
MGKALNFYESLFVVNLTQGDDAVADVVDRFTNLIAEHGQIIDIAKWGKRRLAYPINDLNEGYYVVVTFKSQPAFINELERLLNINEMIMRSLTVKLPYDAEAKFKARAAKAVANEPPAEVAADSTAEVAADSTAEVAADSTAEVAADSTAEVAADSTAEVAAESTAEVAADSTAEVAADSTAEEAIGESGDETAEPEADAGNKAEASEE